MLSSHIHSSVSKGTQRTIKTKKARGVKCKKDTSHMELNKDTSHSELNKDTSHPELKGETSVINQKKISK